MRGYWLGGTMKANRHWQGIGGMGGGGIPLIIDPFNPSGKIPTESEIIARQVELVRHSYDEYGFYCGYGLPLRLRVRCKLPNNATKREWNYLPNSNKSSLIVAVIPHFVFSFGQYFRLDTSKIADYKFYSNIPCSMVSVSLACSSVDNRTTTEAGTTPLTEFPFSLGATIVTVPISEFQLTKSTTDQYYWKYYLPADVIIAFENSTSNLEIGNSVPCSLSCASVGGVYGSGHLLPFSSPFTNTNYTTTSTIKWARNASSSYGVSRSNYKVSYNGLLGYVDPTDMRNSPQHIGIIPAYFMMAYFTSDYGINNYNRNGSSFYPVATSGSCAFDYFSTSIRHDLLGVETSGTPYGVGNLWSL